ncbi:Minf_1886 family protein [Candidatus Latescibacterota bacterium]
MSNTELFKLITKTSEEDGRYTRESFLFILSGLEYTLSKLPKRRHLNGQELSRGITEYAREQYGYLARIVLNGWGIHSTIDYGEIVYLLINEGIMNKTEEDRLEDFRDVFDFESEFSWEKSKPRSLPKRL